ncbi:hypothetical protein [Aquabacter cavernae]|uniref:hypothetical protein n=1 Tax=Aquabacter cavernae TaxID=2496029 RepID=UPI000F8C8294|nr:hypothetical protein [Aquabacter cavernae]
MNGGWLRAGVALACLALMDAGAVRAGAGTSPAALTAARFSAVAYPDLAKWDASGCSFAVFRGKDMIGLFDTQDPKKTALFKIDGTLLFVPAGTMQKGAYWNGVVAGSAVQLIKGKANPKFRNDGGGQGGDGRVEWTGPSGSGTIPVRWEEGC